MTDCHRVRKQRQTRSILSRGRRTAPCTLGRHQTRILHLIAALLLLCMGLVGCGHSSDAMEPDHTPPKHKPATFSEALDEIGRRHEQVAQSVRDSKTTFDEQSISEFLDIIGWLPELAADSSMKKSEWDRANATAKELLSLYQSAMQELKVDSSELRIDNIRVTKLRNDLKSLSDSIEL